MALKLPDVLILAVAAWRLAFMLVREDGPLDVFGRLRRRTMNIFDGVFECVFCTSVWTAALLWLLWHTPGRPVVYVLAASGAGLMIASWTGVEFKND